MKPTMAKETLKLTALGVSKLKLTPRGAEMDADDVAVEDEVADGVGGRHGGRDIGALPGGSRTRW
jgi:hypothetical protein